MERASFSGAAARTAFKRLISNVAASCGTGFTKPHRRSARLHVIDLRSGDVVHWVRLEGMVGELYDVVALPGVVRPMAPGFKTDEIQRLLTVGRAAVL